MKNRIHKLVLAACAVIAAFALTACGSSGSSTEKNPAQNEENTEANDAAAEDTSEVTGKYASIQEFLEDESVQESLQPQIESLEGTGMSMEVLGEDNKLIYSITLEDPDLSALMASDAATLQSSMDSMASSMQAVAATLPAAIDIDNPVVVVRYIAHDGTELASQEFAASDSTAAEDTTAE